MRRLAPGRGVDLAGRPCLPGMADGAQGGLFDVGPVSVRPLPVMAACVTCGGVVGLCRCPSLHARALSLVPEPQPTS